MRRAFQSPPLRSLLALAGFECNMQAISRSIVRWDPASADGEDYKVIVLGKRNQMKARP
jgi:hypothetical protein